MSTQQLNEHYTGCYFFFFLNNRAEAQEPKQLSSTHPDDQNHWCKEKYLQQWRGFPPKKLNINLISKTLNRSSKNDPLVLLDFCCRHQCDPTQCNLKLSFRNVSLYISPPSNGLLAVCLYCNYLIIIGFFWLASLG